ncbi:tyrosine-protein phosphatase non-receptor type 7-like isoform X3 [Aphidius gifuensis]|uniref:tyrosine-protein phosphatase non-receptor type 7-like isoform X3 n=1 Tax=Aphidius gifuensis TaxID=684658 RepID=UPI001CDB66DD|nr:tyrosine-protein phosphatase non-receptor type 7-like isoform X3 [Aphidius gifuensis]
MANFIPIIQHSLCVFKKFKKINNSDMLLCNIYHGSAGNSLSQKFIGDISRHESLSNENDINFDEIYSISEKRWHSNSELSISLLPVAEGMSARSHHRLRQSASGLNDAEMDLQASHLGTRVNQDITSTTIPLFNWEYLLVICALGGAIILTFILLIWLRKQMTSEKKKSDGDRRGLVEEGAFGTATTIENTVKICQDRPMEAQWVRQQIYKSTIATQSNQSLPETKTLPETITVPLTERRLEPIRIKAKGLLERRGSSASLTIELSPVPESPLNIVTPTRECTNEEFLLSAGNILSRTQLKKSIKNPTLLYKEFWEVPLNVPDKVEIFGAGIKNRYTGVLPNSQTRVILDNIDDPVGSYINANYIRGYDGEKQRYIATQGPLQNTIVDFWQMVWMDKVSAIVMMTKLNEASKTKCDMYFPMDLMSKIQAGSFSITLISCVTRCGYIIRDFELRMNGERRNITHYWYDSWPDHAVPQSADSLVSLAAEINLLPGPIIVHCSAGIGRTGCFIALATGMTQLSRDKNVDVLGILCQMRYDRGGMIQTAEQYEFVHRALCLFEQTLDGKSSASGD